MSRKNPLLDEAKAAPVSSPYYSKTEQYRDVIEELDSKGYSCRRIEHWLLQKDIVISYAAIHRSLKRWRRERNGKASESN